MFKILLKTVSYIIILMPIIVEAQQVTAPKF